MSFTLSDLEKLAARGLQVKGLDLPKKAKEETRKLVIYGVYENLNQMLNEAKGNKYSYAAKRKKTLQAIALQLENIAPIPGKNRLHFTWFCPDRRRDPDNISAGRKHILDALQVAGIIENDGWKQIGGFVESFILDKENPRVEIFFVKC